MSDPNGVAPSLAAMSSPSAAASPARGVRTAAIVPARDEAERVGDTVRTLAPIVDEVVVVDDGSADDTLARATEAGAHVLRLPRSRGKGAALAAGLAATGADVIVLIDADVTGSASVARALLGPVLAGEADMTIACPPPSGPSGFGMVESFARRGIHRLTGREMRRPLSGQRAAARTVFERLGFAKGFGVETALTVDALRAGYRVIEVPHAVEHARTGRDLRGFLHRARQGIDIARALASRALRRSGK